MSSRATLFLTEDGDHWYVDVNSYSKHSTPEKPIWNVFLSIGKKDVVSMEYDEANETWFFEIDRDSDLAKHLCKFQG